ncbi:MAG: AAA family ATPase [Planctomycetota bacterium]|jgi:MoxR-like ATPase
MSDSTSAVPGQQGLSQEDLAAAARLQEAFEKIKSELRKNIVGMDQVIEELLNCIFCRGHCLLIGVPGLAKTLLISSLADCLKLSFNRIQFTPDLMPSDITGTEVIQEDKSTGERRFQFLRGPIFANIILADEINRTSPKTQAALLEAMQEYQVTAGGTKYSLDLPFFVLATQNPIEQEGTYSLPEAQLDRFMFNVYVDYPSEIEEFDIMRLTTTTQDTTLEPVMSGDEIRNLQNIVRRIPIADHVINYAIEMVRATRVRKDGVLSELKDKLAWGAGPRASQYLILGGKAHAVLHGRDYVSTEDVAAVAHPVLRHRIILNFAAQGEGLTADDLIDVLLDKVAVPTA